MAYRDREKAAQAQKALSTENNSARVLPLALDLSSLSSVRDFAANYATLALPPLHGLICNAGINGMYTGQSPDGFDIVFATNHLGHFLLTALLLPVMTPSGRIAVVSSEITANALNPGLMTDTNFAPDKSRFSPPFWRAWPIG